MEEHEDMKLCAIEDCQLQASAIALCKDQKYTPDHWEAYAMDTPTGHQSPEFCFAHAEAVAAHRNAIWQAAKHKRLRRGHMHERS